MTKQYKALFKIDGMISDDDALTEIVRLTFDRAWREDSGIMESVMLPVYSLPSEKRDEISCR